MVVGPRQKLTHGNGIYSQLLIALITAAKKKMADCSSDKACTDKRARTTNKLTSGEKLRRRWNFSEDLKKRKKKKKRRKLISPLASVFVGQRRAIVGQTFRQSGGVEGGKGQGRGDGSSTRT